jgi:hypothetical protein
MTAPEGRCWYTLDPKSQPVGPYSIADLAGNGLKPSRIDTLLFCRSRHGSCTCCTVALTAAAGYAASGLVSEVQIFWKEGKPSWDKLSDVPELESVLKALQQHKASAGTAAAATAAGAEAG